MVNREEEALNTPASALISAASNPATTIPRTPIGSTCITSNGKAAWARSLIRCPLASNNSLCREGFSPLFAKAKQIIPGMMKRNTGVSFKKPAKIVPRLPWRSSRAANTR